MYFDYWVAWAITNTTFAICMFHIHRRYIFPKTRNGEEKDKEEKEL